MKIFSFVQVKIASILSPCLHNSGISECIFNCAYQIVIVYAHLLLLLIGVSQANMAINHEAHNASDQSRFSKFSKLYSNYFPTDKESFSIRYSIIGLVISLFSLQLLFFFIWFSDGMIYVHGFYLLIASVHFGLYQALKSEKLRLITPWLIWKIIEVIYLVAVLFRGTIWRHHFSTWNVVFAFLLIVANLTMMFCLYKTQVESTEVRNFQVENESKKSTPDV